MSRDERFDRRALLRGGLAGALAAGAAACSPTTAPTTPRTGGTGAGVTPPTTAAAKGTATPTATGTGDPAALLTPGPDIEHGSRSRPMVSLTFHGAGDPALAREVLAICAHHGAHTTVFAVGVWLTSHAELGRAIVAAGHDLGNHTWSHQPMLRLDRPAAEAEIRDGARAVAAIRGSATLLFRPSGTQHSTAMLRSAARAAGYARCISYDVDPMDYLDPGGPTVARRTLHAVRAGSIVSLHLGHAGTVAALPEILAGIRDRGLATGTVREMLT